MSRFRFLASGLLLATLLLAGGASAGDHEYVGATKCKTCHGKEAIGDQYARWLDSRHAKALDSLKTDKARQWATERGVADPTTDKECVRCHTTAYGVSEDLLGKKFSHDEGVTCEACHGAGKDYRKKSVMIDADDARSKGLIEQNEKVCTACHNDKSPAFKGFDYKTAIKKIAHPVPEGYDPSADEDEE